MTQRRANQPSRRQLIVAAAAVALSASFVGACGAPEKPSDTPSLGFVPQKPSKPIALTILDGGGDLKGGGQAAIDAFVKANPDLVSGVTYQTAGGPEVAGKIKAQQSGGSVDTSLVLGGPDVLGAGQQQNLFLQQLPAYASSLPDLASIQDEGRANLQKMAAGLGVLVNYDPNGPFLDYNPSKVPASELPTTPGALLEWAKAHKGKFAYAQPSASGSGRAFIQALPYLLGDSDPTDPVNGWSKTWAYLEELGKNISTYPAGSALLAQQFAGGQLDLIPTILAHDVGNRKNNTWQPTTGIALFKDQNWISDGHYSMIPKGVSAETLYVVLKLQSYMVQPEAQAHRLTTGVLTTANKNSTLDNSGAAVAEFAQKWGRPDFFPNALKTGSARTPLTPANMQKAFDLWQRNVGSKVGG